MCVRERECPHSTAYTVLPILHSTELFILHTYLCVTYPLCNILYTIMHAHTSHKLFVGQNK